MTVPAIHVSAPGKLFLLGEYAVLEGAPALLTAVDRRAHVRVSPSCTSYWQISAPNLGIHEQILGADGSLPADCSTTLARHLKVFDAVRRHVQRRLNAPLAPLVVDIDTQAFAADGHKLGLGSSAAVAAALTAALLTAADVKMSRDELAQWAIDAHRAAQGGTGSGGDVAVAVYGGVISYIRDTPPVALTWPDTLTGRAAVTGEGASTTDLVGRVYAYGQRAPDDFKRDLTVLAALAEQAADALQNAPRFLSLAADYFAALGTLDAHAQAGIVSARHQALAQLARAHGGVFKSSGAGGGDVGLLFGASQHSTDALTAAFEENNAEILDLVFAAPGLTHHTP